MNALREEAQQALRTYLSRSQASLSVLAPQMGFSHRSMIQFISNAKWGVGEGEIAARKILEWVAANPVALPDFEGELRASAATRAMDDLLDVIADGSWGRLYGPSGSQKSFLLKHRWAEAARTAEPRIIYIEASQSGFTPCALLRRIASALGAGFAQSSEGLRQQIYGAVRRRHTPVGLVVDESDRFYRQLDTLETLREICDALPARNGRPGMGLLVVGNEKVMEIFRDRPGMYMEKWRGRINQHELRVIGPSVEEAREMVIAELGAAKASAIDLLIYGDKARGWAANVVLDPASGDNYVTTHGLFAAIRRVQQLKNKKVN